MPVAIDLYCGLGGWAEGFLAEGWSVIGFDIERHDYGLGGYPGQLVLQDVLTLDGSQFRNATVIVASPPCQNYSYLAMPWSRSKNEENSKAAKAMRRKWETEGPDNQLFDACFRIQREASEAAGRHIPLIVENVKGAQPWVGRARWHFGSYYLWGDVPALMPFSGGRKVQHHLINGRKGDGGGWFGDYQAQKAAQDGIKQGGEWWHDPGSIARRFSSRSAARKAASAEIARIPFELARWIAVCFTPAQGALQAGKEAV